jgi:hypothetical protein
MPVPPASFGGPPPRSVRLSVVRPSIERWEELRASAARLNMQPATASFQPPITPSILGLPPSTRRLNLSSTWMPASGTEA